MFNSPCRKGYFTSKIINHQSVKSVSPPHTPSSASVSLWRNSTRLFVNTPPPILSPSQLSLSLSLSPSLFPSLPLSRPFSPRPSLSVSFCRCLHHFVSLCQFLGLYSLCRSVCLSVCRLEQRWVTPAHSSWFSHWPGRNVGDARTNNPEKTDVVCGWHSALHPPSPPPPTRFSLGNLYCIQCTHVFVLKTAFSRWHETALNFDITPSNGNAQFLLVHIYIYPSDLSVAAVGQKKLQCSVG